MDKQLTLELEAAHILFLLAQWVQEVEEDQLGDEMEEYFRLHPTPS